MIVLALVILMNVICSVLVYGIVLHDFTKHFPYMQHVSTALPFGAVTLLIGPIGLLAILLCSDSIGLRFKPIPKEERWDIFNKEYEGYLDRDYFEQRHG